MKLNTRTLLKDLEGKPIPELEIGKTLGQIIIKTKTTDPLRNYALATRLYNDKTTEIDESDVAFIKTCIADYSVMEDPNKYTSLVTGQILQFLDTNK